MQIYYATLRYTNYKTLHYTTLITSNYTPIHQSHYYNNNNNYYYYYYHHSYNYNCNYITLHYTNYTAVRYNYKYNYNDTTLHSTTLHRFHCFTLQLQLQLQLQLPLHYTALITLHYTTLHYTTLHYNSTTLLYTAQTLVHYTTLQCTTLHHTTLVTPHRGYNCNCATPHYIQQSWWGDHCNHCNSKKHNSNHLSVHQWNRSAIRDLQQPTSPKGFLVLKLPPPPCLVLVIHTNHNTF